MRRWLENPYHQYFCHELPIDPSSLSRWRGRIGEQGSELILQVTVQAGLASGAIIIHNHRVTQPQVGPVAQIRLLPAAKTYIR